MTSVSTTPPLHHTHSSRILSLTLSESHSSGCEPHFAPSEFLGLNPITALVMRILLEESRVHIVSVHRIGFSTFRMCKVSTFRILFVLLYYLPLLQIIETGFPSLSCRARLSLGFPSVITICIALLFLSSIIHSTGFLIRLETQTCCDPPILFGQLNPTIP